MAGGKKRNADKKGDFDEMSDSDPDNGNDSSKSKKKKPKGKSSPRKLNKGKGFKTKASPGSRRTRAIFEEDGNLVQIQVDRSEENEFFPEENREEEQDEDESDGEVILSQNNNATSYGRKEAAKKTAKKRKRNDEMEQNEDSREPNGSVDFMNESRRRSSVERSQAEEIHEDEPPPLADDDEEEGEVDRDDSIAAKSLNDSVAMLQRSVNSVSETMEKWSKMMQATQAATRDFAKEGARPKGKRGKEMAISEANKDDETEPCPTSQSETTIYDNAVKPAGEERGEKRNSSSSEGLIDTSDEMMDIAEQIDNNLSLIAEQTRRQQENRQEEGRDRFYERRPLAGGSRDDGGETRMTDEELAKKRADDLVRQAEAGKAKILEVAGKDPFLTNRSQHEANDLRSGRVFMNDHHPALIDEDYLVVGNHVEENIRERIENGEYVDFARLLPRDRLLMEEDNRMEIVNRNGKTFFVPATDQDTNSITNFSRWEQAFRVFSNIYTRRYPERSAELIQYNHIIHTAALTFTWENVYLYDRDFRLHLARYPRRSWSVILQQAWTMRLKDRNNRNDNSRNDRSKNRKDICWRYNRGKCSYGSSCKFDHRCGICGKFGHGAHICRKGNKNERGDNGYYDGNRKPDRSDKGDRRDDYWNNDKGGRRDYRTYA